MAGVYWFLAVLLWIFGSLGVAILDKVVEDWNKRQVQKERDKYYEQLRKL
jgi:hypothetical protein